MSLHEIMLCACGHPRHSHSDHSLPYPEGYCTAACRDCACKGFEAPRKDNE